MKCKKLVSLFLSLLLATALAVPACAAFEDVFADGSADGTRDGSLIISGETVRRRAKKCRCDRRSARRGQDRRRERYRSVCHGRWL